MTLEIIRKRYINRSFYIVLLLMFILISTMNFIRINNNIRLHGIIKSKKVTYLNSPCDTFLEKTYVSPGEQIEKGQLLAKLDEISINTYLHDLKTQIIEAEQKKAEILINQEIYQYQIDIFQQTINQNGIKLIELEKKLKRDFELLKIGEISESEWEGQESEVAYLKAEIIKLEKELTIFKIEKKQYHKFERDKEELDLLDLKIKRINKKLALINEFIVTNIDDPNYSSVIAPHEGVVVSFLGNTNDDMDSNTSENILIDNILENSTLFEIIKSNDVYIEGNINEIDFPYIYEGDEVVVILPAYPYEEYGFLAGVVDKLYKESLNINGMKMYKCEIRILDLNLNPDIKPYLGLTSINVINIKKDYTLLDYMIKKIFD